MITTFTSPDYTGRTNASIYDLDGTLVDSKAANCAAYQAALATRDIPLSVAEFDAYFGIEGGLILQQQAGKYDQTFSGDDIQKLFRIKEQAFIENIGLVRPNFDIVERLIASAADHHTAIATTAESNKTQRILEMHGLLGYIDLIIDASSVTRSKPDPQCHQIITEHFGLLPTECEVYEDSATGKQAAETFGAGRIHMVEFTS